MNTMKIFSLKFSCLSEWIHNYLRLRHQIFFLGEWLWWTKWVNSIMISFARLYQLTLCLFLWRQCLILVVSLILCLLKLSIKTFLLFRIYNCLTDIVLIKFTTRLIFVIYDFEWREHLHWRQGRSLFFSYRLEFYWWDACWLWACFW